jgi:hypothetical protein
MNLNLSKRVTRTLVAALALAIFAIPAVASAQPGPGDGPRGPEQYEKAKRGNKAKRNKRRFPMKGERFVSIINKRVKKMAARIDRRLDKRNVPPELQAKIKADFAKASSQIQGAAAQAASDGTVTKQEAKKVRQLAKKMRKQARQKYGDKGKRGKGKRGKGKRNAPGQHAKHGPGGQGGPARF